MKTETSAAPDALGDFGIAAGIARQLRQAFEKGVPPQCVWIYGSRARGFARLESDIDLAIDAPDFDERAFLTLKHRIDDLELIYRVDVVWLQDVRDERFRMEIESHRQLFWQGPVMSSSIRSASPSPPN
jgi:predicted nucleotidyltransferase